VVFADLMAPPAEMARATAAIVTSSGASMIIESYSAPCLDHRDGRRAARAHVFGRLWRRAGRRRAIACGRDCPPIQRQAHGGRARPLGSVSASSVHHLVHRRPAARLRESAHLIPCRACRRRAESGAHG
jgi:hypothetical protein